MAKRKQRLFGAHMPIAGGVELAPLHGKKVGCAVMQVFTKNASRWQAKPLEEKSIAAYKENMKDTGIGFVAIHDSYLINLAAVEDEKREKSLDAFIDEIERAHLLGIPSLVFHPGSHLGEGEDKGLKLVAECMNEAIKRTKHAKDVSLTIETTAGQGTNLGHRFEHLGYLINEVKDKSRVSVCVDTCHIFAAGYELREKKGYTETWKQFGDIIGFDYLKCFHINDSKKDFGSRVDRHEHIGKGFLGEEPFRLLLNDERFFDTPMILETPKGKELKEDIENLATLNRLSLQK